MKSNTEEAFDKFWSVKPKRRGSNPKDKAKEKFLRLVAGGIDPEKIIGAARRWRQNELDLGKDNTEFVPMAVTWLNQTRFNNDEYQPPEVKNVPDRIFSCGQWWVWTGEKYAIEEAS